MGKVNLVDSLFDKKHPYEVAILCSFGLDLNFLENYLLNLNGLYPCSSITMFVDASTYDGFLEAAYKPRRLNRRYLVSRIKTAGVFHTKLYILASSKRALIGIGSANLTREGIASNLELLSTFEVSERKQGYGPLLGDCIRYIQRIAQISQSDHAIDSGNALAQICRSYVPEGGDQDLHLIHNLDRPILVSILEHLKDFHVQRIKIVSPFFDSELKPLSRLLQELPECQFEIFLQQKKTNFPINRFESLGEKITIAKYEGIDRYLHGKMILFQCAEISLMYMGSANFTDHALLRTASGGNYEIGIIGPVDPEVSSELISPAGHESIPVHSKEEIEVHDNPELELTSGDQIDYLVEATRKGKIIEISANPAISIDQFRPMNFRLMDLNDASYEGSIDQELLIKLNDSSQKSVNGIIAVQLLGSDEAGNFLQTNIVWVVELEERSGDKRRRRLRRIIADPSELFEILEEIANEGDERELMLFLQTFDIPLDLLLPPRIGRGFRNVKSRGNIVGILPIHQNVFFSATVLDAYDACLDRLFGKMDGHLKHIQPEKVGNFVLILSSFMVLLDFVNAWARDKYSEKTTISGDDWLIIRNCYDMLLKHTTKTWDLVWSKNGYRTSVNAKIAERSAEEGEPAETFEQHLLAEYDNSIDELVEFSFRPLQTFQQLKAQLLIKTTQGKLVRPKVFPNWHLYLEPPALERLTFVLREETPMLAKTSLYA